MEHIRVPRNFNYKINYNFCRTIYEFCFQYGLGISLLEWMMTKVPFYGRIPQDEEDELGDYNPLIITKLLKNYRSHPSILEVRFL